VRLHVALLSAKNNDAFSRELQLSIDRGELGDRLDNFKTLLRDCTDEHGILQN